MSNYRWIVMHGISCPQCGEDAICWTDAEQDDDWYVGDGEDVRCPNCGWRGQTFVDEDRAAVSWHDDPDCDCERCREETRKEELEQDLATALKMLKKIEWQATSPGYYDGCYYCCGWQADGHRQDCELAALLRKYDSNTEA